MVMAMAILPIITLFLIFFSSELPCSSSTAQTWMRTGYWTSASGLPTAEINSALFSHLVCAYAYINASTYQLSISSPTDMLCFPTFTDTVKQKNPSIVTLLAIAWSGNDSVLTSMISQSSSRKSFIDSSITTARSYGFHGLVFNGLARNISAHQMNNVSILLAEWRTAIEAESRTSSSTPTESELILTMYVWYSPYMYNGTIAIESIKKNIDWLYVATFDYYLNSLASANQMAAFAALYNPNSNANSDYGINSWISSGISANKLAFGLFFHGLARTFVNDDANISDATKKGPTPANITFVDKGIVYKEIKWFIERYGGVPKYDATYVGNYYAVGSIWIGFDDVEAIKTKVAYARNKSLLGYHVWQVGSDDNWVLSLAAQGVVREKIHYNKRSMFLVILFTTTAIVILIICSMMWYLRKGLRFIGFKDQAKESQSLSEIPTASEGNSNSPNLLVFSFTDIVVATNNFSFENKLGEGGYGPVYKGNFPNGQEIAAKRLSKSSTQGITEFKNEVMLTAKLQHVNLVRLLGFCTEREEKILIYEFMPNKSLDYYIYDWEKRVQIIEGVAQGLVYLQEYSRLTVIHRDLKASNILLDNEMKPKISDFGLAEIFRRDEFEANTDRIVGTYGYVPPEYVQRGMYSIKSDVYSFGVLLLQIISGKQNKYQYGTHENLNLLESAYELWKDGNGMEFMDPSLDDTYSSCKLMRCMKIALLCVQENPLERPSMLYVSTMLKINIIAINSSKRPAFSTKRKEDEEKEFISQQEICSVDEASITQIEAR